MPIKKIGFFAFIIISVFIINNLVHSTYTLWQKRNLVSNAKAELEKQKKGNQEYKSRLAQVKKTQFVEEEARDKLFLVKPGEGVIVLPTNAIPASPSATPTPPDTRPNWKKWWDVFF